MSGPIAGDRQPLAAVYSIGGPRLSGRSVSQKGVVLFACRRVLTLISTLVLLASAASCGRHNSNLPAPGSVDEDRFLFDKGTALLQDKNWLVAREYFKKLIDTYPQSGFRHDARLGIGDSYIGEGRTESYILAVNEFRQFLQLAPLNRKADYAQYKICLAQSKQMLNSQRDQTATRDALTDCDAFLRAYPTSQLRPEVEAIRRLARNRLSDHEFGVGLTYFRQKVYQGADSRFRGIIADDPGYSDIDRVYYYLAETMYLGSVGDRKKEALPLYERVLEFPNSEYLKKAKERIAEIKR
jgi:outer membrane assembly lipoprotein YfiO